MTTPHEPVSAAEEDPTVPPGDGDETSGVGTAASTPDITDELPEDESDGPDEVEVGLGPTD